MSETPALQKRSFFEKFIHAIEVIGNKFPHPFWLFVVLSLILLGLSYWLGEKGVSVTYMVGKAGETPKETTVSVVNLLSYPAMRSFLADFVKTYVNFAPLGLILTMMLGIGLEYCIQDIVSLRGGFHYGDPAKAIPTFVSLGLGAQFAGVHLDIAFLTASQTLGNTLMFGLGYSF